MLIHECVSPVGFVCGSGNMVGDVGARMLSKALMMNKKLSTIHWDRNNISPQGFSDVAAALERFLNMSVITRCVT